jgi:hypothetical protein
VGARRCSFAGVGGGGQGRGRSRAAADRQRAMDEGGLYHEALRERG